MGETLPEESGLRVGWTEAACDAAAVDADRDGTDDRCEQALATAFAPLLVVDSAECNWDPTVGNGRLGGEYLFAVQRDREGGQLRVAYLPAYYRDCGWRSPACRLTPWLCEPHAGDSEIVVVQVSASGGGDRWTTDGVFLSAHCHGRSDGNCRWYRSAELDLFRWADARPRGAPTVWVASGKHGNYPSRERCDTGHWYYDSCDRNTASYRFPIVSVRQNIGSRAIPFAGRLGSDCVTPTQIGWGSERTDPAARECMWRLDGGFRGWQSVSSGDAPAAYGRYLLERAGF